MAAIAFVLPLWLSACGEAPAPAPTGDAGLQDLAQLEERAQAALANARDLEPITAEIQRFVAEHGHLAGGHRLLGLLLTQQNQPAAAYDHISLAVASEPETAELQAMLGSLAMQLHRPADAASHYGRAIELDPLNMRFRLQLAQVMLSTGDDELAAAQLEEIIRLDASQHAAYAMLGKLEADAGDLLRATELTEKAIAKAPVRDTAARTTYARQQADQWLKLGQPQQAVAALRVLPVEAQTSAAVSADLARAWSAMGQPEKAAKHYEQIAVMVPALVEAPRLAAQWYEQAGMPEEARRMREIARRRGGP